MRSEGEDTACRKGQGGVNNEGTVTSSGNTKKKQWTSKEEIEEVEQEEYTNKQRLKSMTARTARQGPAQRACLNVVVNSGTGRGTCELYLS